MTAAVMSFLFQGEALVRVVEQDGQPWFVAEDVCRALGITAHRDAVARLDPDERASVEVDTPGGPQQVAALGEGALFTLILRSRKAMEPGTVQHRFRRWVVGDVLPAVRRTGGFLPGSAVPIAYRIRLVTEARQVFGPRVAADVWRLLKLPTVPGMEAVAKQGELPLPAPAAQLH